MSDMHNNPHSNSVVSLDQRRAAFALARVRELKDLGEARYGNYVSYVSSLPAILVMNGLGQGLTTLVAKAKGQSRDPHRVLFDHLAGWLSQQIEELHEPSNDLTKVIDHLMEADQSVYVRAQIEAMAFLNWLKQFARAYLKEQKEELSDEN